MASTADDLVRAAPSLSRSGSRAEHFTESVPFRYGLALLFVAIATASVFYVHYLTGRFLSFPFYVVVVASAWFGSGPGILGTILSILIVEDIWTPPLFSLAIAPEEVPAFVAFVLCALMSFAWSSHRRKAQRLLEATVQQRTTELRASNQALQEAQAELARTLRLATLAEVAAAIAHEINQPLAAITANGSACLRSLSRQPPLLDTAREAAGCIVADGHRAGDVIARIRALFDKEQPQRQRVDVNALVLDVLALFGSAIERGTVQVRTALAPDLPVITADPVQLRQVVVNLVTNALEALEQSGGHERRLAVRSRSADGNAIAVTIEDTGTGLAPDQLDHVFESFYTTKKKGIGVGLAISRSIIEAHGGTLWGASNPSGGATFGFTLPLLLDTSEPAEKSS